MCVVATTATAASWGIAIFAPSSTESAVANGDTRTLHLYHTHTGESIDATFRVDGHYDPNVLRQLNHFLRDWRNNDETNMDPRLFDAVWEAYRTAGATDPIQIYSAYRSPETNAMLRRRSRAVAEHSQHMLGKAMDTTMPGFPMERIREAGMRLQHGGVGWYPSANFVHLDVGGVRSWPRMSYDQLASIFPDGKTVHIAADGRTLPGYDQARVEIAERGGTEVPPAQQSQGFMAWLFGGGNGGATAAREDEEDRRAPAAASAPAAVASVAPIAPQPEAPAPALAYAAAGEPANPTQPPPAEGQATNAPVAQQVATLAPADAPIAADIVLPMPPRRPADLDADAVDIPLPPIRPVSFAALETAPLRASDAQVVSLPSDAIGGLIASGVSAGRKSRLPSVILQGLGGRTSVPGPALAFAGVDETPAGLRIPEPVARPAAFGKPIALRPVPHMSRQHTAALPSRAVAEDDDLIPVAAGPKLIGLRKAARLAAADPTL